MLAKIAGKPQEHHTEDKVSEVRQIREIWFNRSTHDLQGLWAGRGKGVTQEGMREVKDSGIANATGMAEQIDRLFSQDLGV